MANTTLSAPINPPFRQANDPNDLIWRYLSLSKFISLIETGSLFLTRVDLFNDLFEGTLPKTDNELWRKSLPSDNSHNWDQMLPIYRQALRKNTHVNCWHLNNEESEAMWKLYCGSNEGIAIQSTYQKLKDSIQNSKLEIGLIRYINYETESFPPLQGNFYAPNFAHPFMHKRIAFEHEREVRVIKIDYSIWSQIISADLNQLQQINTPLGISHKVNVEELVQKIYIHPLAPTWYFDVVQAVISKYSLNVEVKWSSMTSDPIY